MNHSLKKKYDIGSDKKKMFKPVVDFFLFYIRGLPARTIYVI